MCVCVSVCVHVCVCGCACACVCLCQGGISLCIMHVIDRSVGRWSRSVGRSVRRSDRSVDRSVGQPVGRSVGRSAGQPVGSIRRSVSRSVGQSVAGAPRGKQHASRPHRAHMSQYAIPHIRRAVHSAQYARRSSSIERAVITSGYTRGALSCGAEVPDNHSLKTCDLRGLPSDSTCHSKLENSKCKQNHQKRALLTQISMTQSIATEVY